MGSEIAGAKKPGRRITQSRLAKPLLTSMGTITMLAASTFVLLAVGSTGSARPSDWVRADPAAAVRLCGHQGLGAIGCMLGGAFRPAMAAPARAGTHAAQQPLVSVATVADQMPAGASSTAPGSRPAASAKPAGRSGAASAATRGQRLVIVPPGASMDDVLTACATAMQTAQAQGPTAMAAVTGECEADLRSLCPAVRMPRAQGAMAVQELRDECEPVPSPSARPRESGDD